MVVYNFQQQATTQETLTINQVAADIQSGKVERLVEDENRLRVIYTDGSESTSQKEGGASLIEQLKELGVTTEQLQPDKFNLESKSAQRLVRYRDRLRLYSAFYHIGWCFLVRFPAGTGWQQRCTFVRKIKSTDVYW